MFSILYEDNHCLAIDKPAGLLSQGDITGDVSAVDLARAYLRERYNKPGNVYIGLVHRLDRPVSGVLLLAKTSKAAARLTAQFRDRTVEKGYFAVVEGRPKVQSGIWTDRLWKDPASNRVTVTADSSRGVEASLAYEVVEVQGAIACIRLRPSTGRGHQLRVQLASRRLPILGDGKYGSSLLIKALDGGRRIALHASVLSFNHPTLPQRIEITSPLPADWPGPWRSYPPGNDGRS